MENIQLKATFSPGARRSRGRPPGSGRKHPDGCKPKTLRNFSTLSDSLLAGIQIATQMKMTDAEIIEEALIRLARSHSNELPELDRVLRKVRR